MQVDEKWEDSPDGLLHQDAENCTKTSTKLAPAISRNKN